ncbi:DinB family protein [Cryobacterium sp. GrIS_2_6]|uniref:DinB family protein n=1 Tax=Cryobacterium sp. GrIS_2_6 TaxID=3162785 RepID=UPI002E0BAE99|nr:hypothetical protein [Cryobacterium psychrotolerans]
MNIPPDTKDWTWVLKHPCPECGFVAAEVVFEDIPRLIRENAAAWLPVLERADVAVRPNEHAWSALEYAAHVRDVFRIFTVRLALMRIEDDPLFPNWDQDATAVAERYGEQAPERVAVELAEAASSAAVAFAAVPAADLGRVGRRSDGARFTVTTMGQYFVHDPVHHLHDVTAMSEHL